MPTYEIVTHPEEGIEITWEGTYEWNQHDPPENGVELTDDPRPVCVTYYHKKARVITLNNIEHGSLMHHYLLLKYSTPSDIDQWVAAYATHEDNQHSHR